MGLQHQPQIPQPGLANVERVKSSSRIFDVLPVNLAPETAQAIVFQHDISYAAARNAKSVFGQSVSHQDCLRAFEENEKGTRRKRQKTHSDQHAYQEPLTISEEDLKRYDYEGRESMFSTYQGSSVKNEGENLGIKAAETNHGAREKSQGD